MEAMRNWKLQRGHEGHEGRGHGNWPNLGGDDEGGLGNWRLEGDDDGGG